MKCAKEKFKNHVNNIEKIPWRKKRREWSWCFQNIFPTKWSLVNVQQKENTGKGNEKKWGGEKRKDKSWVAMHSGLIFTGLLIFRAVAEPRNSGKSAKSREIHKNTQNTAKFGRNRIKYMSVQQFWNLSQLLAVFTCRKLANLCQTFVTETWKQCPETTRLRLCCEKLGTSHDVKVFSTGSFLERIVVERANDDVC